MVTQIGSITNVTDVGSVFNMKVWLLVVSLCQYIKIAEVSSA